MKIQKKKFRNAIFLVTDERACPIYNPGDELKVEQLSLTVTGYKPVCLFLSEAISQITTSKENFAGYSKFGGQKSRFDCGGCDAGLIRFEFKKEKEYATLQMKLLTEAEERRKRQHLNKFFGVLRGLDMFEALDDDALSDLTVLLDLKSFPIDKVIIKKGDPGTHLYIVLQGKVAVMASDGSRIAEIGVGEVFGEMSLLSGEPVSSSIYTISPTQVALLSMKNFKHVLRKYPLLQLFLLRMLVDRAQKMTLKSGNIASGMTGELEEVAPVDLFQLINSSQKSGTIELNLDTGKAMVFFVDGEIVHARYLDHRDNEAVFALLSVKKGHFSFAKGLPNEVKSRDPIGGFMGMMMEGLQRIDEEGE
ncbi:MAG: DUF4388 domain-containing protein [Thermodesulfobacteriota bacterium]